MRSSTITEAIDLAGAILAGVDWIGRLTSEEIDILKDAAASQSPPSKAAKLERAKTREAKMNQQRRTALGWIFENRILTLGRGFECDYGALIRALAVERTKRAGHSDGLDSKRGRPKDLRKRVIVAMLVDLLEEKLTADFLRAAKQDYLARRYSAARKTCVEAKKVALAEWEVLKPSN